MLLNAAAASALLAFFAIATPIAQNQNAGKTPGSNRCDNTTFNDGADLDIPQAPVEDCRQLVANIDPYSTFPVTHDWSTPFDTVGDCTFNIRIIAGQKEGLVGGADAKDLIGDSADKFGEGDTVSCRGSYTQAVSAEGEVSCDNNGDNGQVRVQWIVASSSYDPEDDEDDDDDDNDSSSDGNN